MNKYDELVLVAPTAVVLGKNPEDRLQGIFQDKNLLSLYGENHSYARRGDMEENPQFKQLIPYVFITRGDEFFVYERLNGGGEERLHNKLSLGVGGHVNKGEDERFAVNLFENAMRELEEELVFPEGFLRADGTYLHNAGYINDDSDSVGAVHLGAVLKLEIPEDMEIDVRETDTLAGSFMTKEQLKENYARFENWSQFVIDELSK